MTPESTAPPQPATVPPTLRAALGLAAGFFAFVAWDQSAWWRAKPDYAFGWLVPFFVFFVVRDRWPRIVAAVHACAAVGSPRASGAGAWLGRGAATVALAGGALMFLLGALLRASAGASQPATLALTLGAAAMALPLIFFSAPESPAPLAAGFGSDARVRLAAWFLFPVLVWIVSAPLVSAVETQLNLFLLHKVVTVVAFVFDLLGLPLEQQGNVLVLPNGNVGVEDACSGIRSLTACLFAGSFLAAVFLDRFWKKIALVAAALLLAFVTNLGRSLFLTAWAWHHGPESIAGFVHDAAGYAVLGLTTVGLLVLLPVLNLRLSAVGKRA
ncbi:MAG: exosortase/archaeosortase family protein [Opitutaceae bacterium]|nr:exosortase/archaeosortase family protein [Opitutaceae bacterium]